jgi:hypothetical protein
MKISRHLAPAATAALLTLALTGCSPIINLEPAELANDPACAEIIVRLPDSVGGLAKRATNAQATGAWGDPTAVILRCGLEPVEVSSLTCVTASDIDWLVDDAEAPSYRFISYGRNPATEVIVDSTQVAGVTALDELAGSVQAIEATKRCTTF